MAIGPWIVAAAWATEPGGAPSTAPRAAAAPAVALVWGGGARGGPDGRLWLQRYVAERAEIEALVVPAPGYPRLVDSATLPGMKPGFDVVVLGLCATAEGTGVRDVLRTFYDGVYVRDLANDVDPGACPIVRHEASVIARETVHRGVAARSVTEVAVERDDGTDGGESARGDTRSEIVAVVRADTGDRRSVDVGVQGDTADPGFGTACTAEVEAADHDAVRVVTRCSLRTVECGTRLTATTTVFSVDGGVLVKTSADEELAAPACVH
ncbi:MAG: hypothetical protein ABMB14_30000 [Myxococcota bacterium]